MFTFTSLTVVLVGDPVEHGRDGVARPAPLGPEVDDHLALGRRDLALERRLGCFDCHSVSFRRVAARFNAARGPRSSRSVESKLCSNRCPTSPIRTRSSSRSSTAGSARARSSALRERNRGGPKWSFIDGPVTANKKLAVHTAWGRTLKDVFQRYKALRGFDQRYQNGFDCQGLWIEVGVERQLGLQLEARDRGVRARGVRAHAAARSSSSRPRS